MGWRYAMAVLVVAGCDRTPAALKEGGTWTSTEVPPSMAGKVSKYETLVTFGYSNYDTYAWQGVVKYTMRADLPGPDAGCSFTGRIPGTWKATDSTLTVTTDSATSGALEKHECPNGAMASTVKERPPHFTTWSTKYRLDGDALYFDRRFDEEAPVTLTRFRAPR